MLWTLFLTFFRIGAFTFGGGYAMISVIENICVEQKKWITHEDLVNVTVIAESTPGPVAINCATFVGYKQKGIWGSIAATLGVVLPSFIIIWAISMFLERFLEIAWVASAFRGVRVAVIKHDGHDFDIDHEGTDSDRFTRAGADVSGIFSDTHAAILLNGHIEAEKLIFLISMSGTADLIITEGCKKGKWPKILLYRESSGKPMAADPDTCAAVVSDVQVQTSAPVFPLDDPDALAEYLTGSMLL